jgi:hypothetical protein
MSAISLNLAELAPLESKTSRFHRVGLKTFSTFRTELFVPGHLAAIVAKLVRELLPVFGHSAANPTNEFALPTQVRPDLTLLALGVVRHEEEASGAVRQLSIL